MQSNTKHKRSNILDWFPKIAPAQKNLRICETLLLDPKRRIVKITNGQQDYLILLGVSGETLLNKETLISQEDYPTTVALHPLNTSTLPSFEDRSCHILKTSLRPPQMSQQKTEEVS